MIKITLKNKSKSHLNEETFNKLYLDYHIKLCHYAFYIVNSREIAEEIVQDFFVNLWKKREQIKIKQNVTSYMFISIRNSANNVLKKNLMQINRKKLITIEEETGQTVFNKDFFLKKLKSAINKLPEKCRLVYCMKYIEGLTYNEIAMYLNITEKTVETQLYKALHKLRKELAPYKPDFYTIEP